MYIFLLLNTHFSTNWWILGETQRVECPLSDGVKMCPYGVKMCVTSKNK